MRIYRCFAALALFAACGPASVSVPMRAESNSGQTGTTTLTQEGGKVSVKIAIAAGADTGSQPVHLHVGKCGQIGNIRSEWPLAEVVAGVSETVIDATVEQLTGLAFNVHNSRDPNVYVSCGNVP